MLLGVLLLISLAFASTQDLINQYCSGNPDCFLCTDGNTIKRCYQNKLCTIGMKKCSVNINCPSGFTYNPQTKKCEQVPQTQVKYIDCSSWGYRYAECSTSFTKIISVSVRIKYSKSGCYLGYSYGVKNPNKIWVNHGCRAKFNVKGVSCPSGSNYNSSTSKCETSASSVIACPLGNHPCIKYTDGNYYCSSYQCYDIQNTPTQITDTPEGINDKQNDGTVTDKGCIGTIYIFNGQDMRCRLPGTQTGYSDCCKKTKSWFGLANCSQREQQLAKLRSWGKLDGNCHYVGKYCAEWWPSKSSKIKTCVQYKKTYCCFSSPLARIIHEYGRPQLGIGWGSPESPNCRGFTPEEFQKLDFSKIDFSEWIEEEVKANISPSIQTSISSVIQNVQSSYSGGSP